MISPLRYDVIIRRDFLALLDEHRSLLAEDPRALTELARGHAYFEWFREIVYPRDFAAARGSGGEAIDVAFEDRVRQALELCESFSARGFDTNHPIVLRTGRTIAATASGKLLAQRVYAGDGCHRLALLQRAGVEVLEPGSYVLRQSRRYEPLDNTLRMLKVLQLDKARYFRFLSLAYGGGRTASDRKSLLELASEQGRRDEAAAVIAVDEPHLVG